MYIGYVEHVCDRRKKNEDGNQGNNSMLHHPKKKGNTDVICKTRRLVYGVKCTRGGSTRENPPETATTTGEVQN